MRKKRPARVLFAALLFMVFYFLLFPYPLGRELVAHPRWAVPAPTQANTPVGQGHSPTAASPFQLGDRFGYVQGDGAILYAGTALYRVALSSTGFVNYTRLGTDWILQDTTGRRTASFAGSGYPFLGAEGNRIFNVKSDLTGIIELDRGGGTLWERDFPAMMTTVSQQGDYLLAGLLNGSLVLLNRQGSPLFEFSAPGSRIPVVLGDAVAPDGTLLAAVSGIGPQYLTVLRKSGSGFAIASRRELPSEFRREVRMGFSPDSRCLFLEGREGPGLFDTGGQSLRWMSLRGTLAGAAWPGGGRFAALAARDGPRAQLAIEPCAGVPVCREEFSARELYLGTIDGQLLLGWDGQLLRIDVEAM